MSNEVTSEEKLISKKAIFHKHCNVHVSFKDGTWENGYILEVGADYLILEFLNEQAVEFWESKKKEFFFMEIKDIEELRRLDE